VLVKVEAFGLNRSELHMRLGLAEGVTFPRVPGIEATGVVAACPGGEIAAGQQVAGVRLTGYTGDATDLPPAVLQEFLVAVAAGDAVVPIGRVFHLEEIQEAHRVMEAQHRRRQIVVVTSSPASAPR
jgi:NADPH:quinone reductase-like Zn-dependent oxidoreductase